MYISILKPGLDRFIASFAIIMLLPLIAALFVGIYLRLGSPVLYMQVRPGRHGRPFTMYKFRTMTDERDANGNLLADIKRLTAFGKFLRSTSLDEIPELINVLKGEMSLVGPRPLLMQYLERYTPEQARRHEVKPGITGWAQINGRNALSWEEKFNLDTWYVANCSFVLDMKILFLTIWKVFRRQDISHTGEATMSEFRGYAETEVVER
jgi:sugar transferase EpsL